MSRLVGGHLIDRKMSRCQDVKMSILVGGHLMARELSRVFWAIVVRCQDVKMIRCLDRGVRLVRYSRFLRPSREMSRCQDVKMSGIVSVAREMSRGFCVLIIRCQDVKMSKMSVFSVRLN